MRRGTWMTVSTQTESAFLIDCTVRFLNQRTIYKPPQPSFWQLSTTHDFAYLRFGTRSFAPVPTSRSHRHFELARRFGPPFTYSLSTFGLWPVRSSIFTAPILCAQDTWAEGSLNTETVCITTSLMDEFSRIHDSNWSRSPDQLRGHRCSWDLYSLIYAASSHHSEEHATMRLSRFGGQ